MTDQAKALMSILLTLEENKRVSAKELLAIAFLLSRCGWSGGFEFQIGSELKSRSVNQGIREMFLAGWIEAVPSGDSYQTVPMSWVYQVKQRERFHLPLREPWHGLVLLLGNELDRLPELVSSLLNNSEMFREITRGLQVKWAGDGKLLEAACALSKAARQPHEGLDGVLETIQTTTSTIIDFPWQELGWEHLHEAYEALATLQNNVRPILVLLDAKKRVH